MPNPCPPQYLRGRYQKTYEYLCCFSHRTARTLAVLGATLPYKVYFFCLFSIEHFTTVRLPRY